MSDKQYQIVHKIVDDDKILIEPKDLKKGDLFTMSDYPDKIFIAESDTRIIHDECNIIASVYNKDKNENDKEPNKIIT